MEFKTSEICWHFLTVEHELPVVEPVFQLVTGMTLGSFMTSERFYDEMFGSDSLLETNRPALKYLVVRNIFDIQQGQNVESRDLWLIIVTL